MSVFNRLFGRSKRATGIRDTLFGDMSLDQWAAGTSPEDFPWSAIAASRSHLAASNIEGAIQCWREVLAAQDLESRHYLQAWHFLRQYGQHPTADFAKLVLGVVVEVGMPKGLDLLAAYPTHSARYYSCGGAGVVWEHSDNSIDSLIASLLSASAQVVAQIGPWDKDRPPAPPPGQVRLSFLTPSGLHFGQGPISAIASDPVGGRVFQLATGLMQALITKTSEKALG
jgi:hypothetical protein